MKTKTTNTMKKLAAAVMSIIIAAAPAPTSASASVKGREVAEASKTFVGISGKPNKVTDYWGGLITDWCAMLLALISDMTNVSQCFPRSTYVDRSNYPESERLGNPGFRDWFEARGRFSYRGTYTPQPGDLIIYRERDDNGKLTNIGGHIGVVVDVDASGCITSVEGNVSDACCYRYHNVNDEIILGYCRPAYNDVPDIGVLEQPAASSPSGAVSPGAYDEPVTPLDEYAKYRIKSDIGAWLRAGENYGARIDIVSYGTVIYSDKRTGEWVHAVSVNTLNGGVYNGWIHASLVEKVSAEPEPETPAVTTTAAPVTAPETTVTTAAPVQSVPQQPSYGYATHYVSNDDGANGRSYAAFGDNIIRIVDTDTRVCVYGIENGFAYCEIPATGEYMYIHTSTLGPIENIGYHTNGTRATHYVSSDIGCNLRASGSYGSGVIAVLDYMQNVTVLSAENECGYVYCEVNMPDGSVCNGYIASVYLCPV